MSDNRPAASARGDVYVHVNKDTKVRWTAEAHDDCRVDLTAAGPACDLVGVEVLGAVEVTVDGVTVWSATSDTAPDESWLVCDCCGYAIPRHNCDDEDDDEAGDSDD